MEHPIPLQILEFISEHHVLTLATSVENKPYCATCFYAYDKRLQRFIVTSGLETKHARESLDNPNVSGAIALETKMVGKIRGLQFTGRISILENDEFRAAKRIYLRQFPVAALASLTLWQIEPDFFKYTDNRLGFGKKMIWEKK